MFRFEHPEFFWLLIVTLAVIGSLYYRKYKWYPDLRRWSNQSTARRLQSILKDTHPMTWLSVVSLLLLNLALVNPQWGFKTRSIEKKTADVYILLDISNSMLAEDIAPNRLERAKRLALDISRKFRTDRIGLILFAGNAYMQSPLTTDWNAIQLYLHAAHPDQAGTQGTAIGKAIRLAISADKNENPSGQSAMIIITDGEDHDSDALPSIKEAANGRWVSYVVGVGTVQGATIPIMIDSRPDVKRDASGQPVITTLNRNLMTELAQAGNGKYYDIEEGNAILADLEDELAKIERTNQEKRSFSEHKSYYQWILMAALIAIMLVPAIRYRHDVI